ncbi:MAG: hypothetical protein DI565_02610 [Ancylobacter novellus]|uniref:Uncharacterized protein n=1 Tax=Ancylobacter novellus TaxID=921 RepID=A0A2W5KQB5_ANCNO|nr:MAG: hypothetical protein DI565_02610 [Ancylobacter novellus]
MRAALTFVMLVSAPAMAQPADDIRLLRQLGYVAGQAVACDIEQPEIAAQVATAMADAMGLKDETSHRLMTDQALNAAAEPCAAPAGRLDEIKANWKSMRKRAGID